MLWSFWSAIIKLIHWNISTSAIVTIMNIQLMVPLVCDDTTSLNNFFEPDVLSMCPNQQEVSCCLDGFAHDWIRTVNFENCERPQIPNYFLQVYYNVHTLNMSALDMTNDNIGFLAHAFSTANSVRFLNLSTNSRCFSTAYSFWDALSVEKSNHWNTVICVPGNKKSYRSGFLI